MISWRTIWLLLLALMLGTGIRLWALGQRDPCARFLGGDKSAPATQEVASGRHTIAVPCQLWIPRQSFAVQAFCLADLLAALMFLSSGVMDILDRMQARRWRREGRPL